MERLGIEIFRTDGSAADCARLLQNFGYETGHVDIILDRAHDAKRNLRNILSVHPNWNEQYQSIIFSCDYNKGIEDYQTDPFLNWIYRKIRERHFVYSIITKEAVDYNNNTVEENILYSYVNNFTRSNEPLITAEMAESLGEYASKAKINQGLKTTKAIQRLCNLLKVTDIKEMKPVTHNGVESMKDYGWNYQYAQLCDALTPQTISRWTVISIHPMAYWTMSFGHKWASCHTIDIEGLRGYEENGSHTYQGCYSSGTESYMLDSSTVMFYTVDPQFEEDELLLAPKMQRCNFHISETGEIIIQGRVYPDGRDGGDNSLAAQYRQTMQKVLSECLAFNNLWTLKKGTGACSEYSDTDSDSTHYRDYEQYDDCSVSILKEIKEDSPKMVYIGAAPICPSCGYTHSRENNICCDDCVNDEYTERCYCCGSRINTETDCYYDDGNGRYFCDLDCAAREGYYLPYDTDDSEVVHESNLYYEESTDRYFYYGDDGISVGDRWYHNEQAARNDGCEYCPICDDWYGDGDFETDSYTGESFAYWSNTSRFIEYKGEYFINDENMDAWIAENESEEESEVA